MEGAPVIDGDLSDAIYLFLVYNDSRGIQARRDTISDRSLLLKFSGLFDLLD
ncbi:MAG: hypothetical protein VYC91_06005 [Acidobacteriota bacterium]|nr:hypothetical protein [Acidobacteriota bacterium]